MTAFCARLPLRVRRQLRPWLPMACPLWAGETWRITRVDLVGFGSCLLMGGGAFWVWRLFSV